jgi:hypothetical protein
VRFLQELDQNDETCAAFGRLNKSQIEHGMQSATTAAFTPTMSLEIRKII